MNNVIQLHRIIAMGFHQHLGRVNSHSVCARHWWDGDTVQRNPLGHPIRDSARADDTAYKTTLSHLLSIGLYASSHTVLTTARTSHRAYRERTRGPESSSREGGEVWALLTPRPADHLVPPSSSNPFSLLWVLLLPWPASVYSQYTTVPVVQSWALGQVLHPSRPFCGLP